MASRKRKSTKPTQVGPKDPHPPAEPGIYWVRGPTSLPGRTYHCMATIFGKPPYLDCYWCQVVTWSWVKPILEWKKIDPNLLFFGPRIDPPEKT